MDGFLVARRYALRRKIGSGGMGSVWLAHDQSLDRVCALKILDPDKADNDEVRKRFLREARATAQIRSPHVVEVFEHGVWDGLPFIVMELLEGEELGARLDRVGRLDRETTHSVIAQIARALARAHALGIVHRDLKPENVFLVPVDGGEIVKVLDFGIARHAVYSPRDRATQAGSVMGTPCYMSPEQALGEEIDWRSDLWGLGVLAFECLTGKLPFYHDALGGLLAQIIYEPIPSIRKVAPATTLPEAVEAWWRRAAERDRERRFQTAAELSDGLAEALGVNEPLAVPELVPCSEAHRVQGIGFEGASESVTEFAVRVASDAPVAMDTGEIITQFRRKVRRRSAWTWVAAAGVIAGLAASGAWLRERILDEHAARASELHAIPAAAPAPMTPPAGPAESARSDGPAPDASEPASPSGTASPSETESPFDSLRSQARPSTQPSPPPSEPSPAFEPPAPSVSPPRQAPPEAAPKKLGWPPLDGTSWPKPRPSHRNKPKPTRDYGI